MRRFSILLWPAGAALGIAAEWSLYGWSDVRHWLPDLAVGWTFIACGLVASSRRPGSRSGPLLALTGFSWFAGNFWGQALFLYRGPLAHVALTYPGAGRRSRLDRAAVAVAYAVSVVRPVWQSWIATVLLAVAFVAVAARGYLGAAGRERRERLAALEATAGLAVVLGLGVADLVVSSASSLADATLLLYQIGLCALAVGLLAGLLTAPWAGRGMRDLVVELGETRSGTLRDALAQALGDPSLRVGYRLAETGGYVDADGRPFRLPEPGPEVAVTYVGREAERVAVLVHDPAALDDPELMAAVASASSLASANAQLQAGVRGRLAELEAARRRLVTSGDVERQRLEQRLHDGAEQRLLALGATLAQARAAGPGAAADRVERANAQLERTLAELDELARGLHPRVLADEGLAGALRSLAERSAVPVELSVGSNGLPEPVEAGVYFVCSEALANVAKYASASRVAVRIVAGDDSVAVEVADDGVGGADPAGGTGLTGLADRVEALGGRLELDSPPGSGTRVRAELPIR